MSKLQLLNVLWPVIRRAFSDFSSFHLADSVWNRVNLTFLNAANDAINLTRKRHHLFRKNTSTKCNICCHSGKLIFAISYDTDDMLLVLLKCIARLRLFTVTNAHQFLLSKEQ